MKYLGKVCVLKEGWEGGSSCCEWVCSHRSYFLSLQDFSHSEGVRIQISGNVDFSHRLDWTSSACKVDMSTKTNFPPPLRILVSTQIVI